MINKLLDAGYKITNCLFSESLVKPKFNVDSPWSVEEKKELRGLYKKETRDDLDRVRSVHYPESLTLGNPLVSDSIECADFIIVSGADRIRGDLLSAIESKSLNVHMGIAEAYRGLDSNLWAWYHRDYKNIGVTLHKLQASLDTGDLFHAERLKITDSIKVWELRYYESALAVKLIGRTLNEMATQNVFLQPQKSTGRYYSFMPFEIKKYLQITPKPPIL